MDPPLSNPFQNKIFIKLRDEWYSKLKETGFVDIERALSNSSDSHLEQFESSKKNLFEDVSGKQQYYQMANEFLAHFKFECEQDREIWELHTNTFSYRKIAKVMNYNGRIYNKDKIGLKIRLLKSEMKRWLCTAL